MAFGQVGEKLKTKSDSQTCIKRSPFGQRKSGLI